MNCHGKKKSVFKYDYSQNSDNTLCHCTMIYSMEQLITVTPEIHLLCVILQYYVTQPEKSLMNSESLGLNKNQKLWILQYFALLCTVEKIGKDLNVQWSWFPSSTWKSVWFPSPIQLLQHVDQSFSTMMYLVLVFRISPKLAM